VLFETEDHKVLMTSTMAWCDLTKLEGVLVTEADEAMKFVKSQAKAQGCS
jgi:hypothetical protein